MKTMQNPDRRKFIKSASRYLALTGLGVMGTLLGIRSQDSSETETCLVTLPCRRCKQQKQCIDPERLKRETNEGSPWKKNQNP